MPGKKIARKRPGSRCEADLALRTARALPPPFLLWLVAYCTFSTPPYSRQEIPELNQLHTYKHNGQDECLCLIFRQYLWKLLIKGWTRWRALYGSSSAVSFTQLKTNIYSPKSKTKRHRLSQINHSFQKYILLWVADQPPQRNHVTKSAGVSDLDNFWR